MSPLVSILVIVGGFVAAGLCLYMMSRGTSQYRWLRLAVMSVGISLYGFFMMAKNAMPHPEDKQEESAAQGIRRRPARPTTDPLPTQPTEPSPSLADLATLTIRVVTESGETVPNAVIQIYYGNQTLTGVQTDATGFAHSPGIPLGNDAQIFVTADGLEGKAAAYSLVKGENPVTVVMHAPSPQKQSPPANPSDTPSPQQQAPAQQPDPQSTTTPGQDAPNQGR